MAGAKDEKFQAKVDQLIEMGFDEKQARNALEKTGGNMGRAIRWLSGVPESVLASSTPSGGGSYHSQMNFGPSMTFHTVSCNNVMIGSHQKMTVVENHIYHPGMGPPWRPRGHAHSSARKDQPTKQLAHVTRDLTERDGGGAPPPQPKSCFISYSAETADEFRHVSQLAKELRANGIDCDVDIYYEDNPPMNWSAWLEQEITSRDVTLICCSRSYITRLEEKRRIHQYNRVHFEGKMLHSLLMNTSPNRFIPIFLGAHNRVNVDYIPRVLRSSKTYHIDVFPPKVGESGHEHFNDLYRFLSRQDT
ncbi:uncharacterized protein LOC134193903 [Corticium candelabrum]|uniref:uncharacterized protein LOC134193903 n=1 Tax=Corticium candelabrum TaxID=121492 RepID=UPI002E261289|nr:uncharacterized protein LOC134193903 [Corticium candelabrum]